jgi:hypothetical protein
MTPLRTLEAIDYKVANDITFGQNVIVAGNLTVQGTETILNTEILNIEDKNIVLGNVDTPTDTTANDGGITLKGTTDKSILYNSSNNRWVSNLDVSAPNFFVVNSPVATQGYVNTIAGNKENRLARFVNVTTNNYVVGDDADNFLESTILLVNSSSDINIILTLLFAGGNNVQPGTQITMIRQGTGRVTVSPASGVTINSAQGHRAIKDRYGSITAVFVGSGTWIVIGSLEA